MSVLNYDEIPRFLSNWTDYDAHLPLDISARIPLDFFISQAEYLKQTNGPSDVVVLIDIRITKNPPDALAIQKPEAIRSIPWLPRFRTVYQLPVLFQLDTSQYPFPNILWHVKPANEIALKTTAMLFIGMGGIYLNSIILIILIKNKWLWTASNYLIGNLALVDFLTLLLCPWFMLVRDFYQNYVLRHFGCRFEGFLQASSLLANVGAVMLVSYDRLAAAALTSDARVTKKAAPKLIAATWLVACLLSLPWIIKREFIERPWLDYLEMFCVEDRDVLGIYWHFIIILLVWLPLGIMVVTYGTIMWRLEVSTRALSSRGTGRAMRKMKRNSMRLTACVLLAAVVCRVPYTVLIYWRNNLSLEINAVDGAYAAIWFSASFLMYVNSAVNPLIYGFTNVRFRKAMDRTPGVACYRFGAWCCTCSHIKRKNKETLPEKDLEKVFVIEATPRSRKKIPKIIKGFLHINRDTVEVSVLKINEVTTRPTKVTPLKIEHIDEI